MELEGFKSAWQRRAIEGQKLATPSPSSRSLQLLRTSVAGDLQRSEELSRLIFSFLFALVVVGASLEVMEPGAGRVIAWLFAAALLVDGIAAIVLLIRRLRQAATDTVLQFISREYGQLENRLRIERYTHGFMLVLAFVALLLQVFGPKSESFRDDVFRMAIFTAFLGVAWRRGRTRSRSREVSQELQSYLKDLGA